LCIELKAKRKQEEMFSLQEFRAKKRLVGRADGARNERKRSIQYKRESKSTTTWDAYARSSNTLFTEIRARIFSTTPGI